MRELLAVDEARDRVLAAVAEGGATPTEDVPVAEAGDRVLAEAVVAAHDVPRFAISAMDGLAVRTGPAGRTLTVVGESRAGAPARRAVGDGEAILISTGAALPAGADGVVMVEDTERRDDGTVVVHRETVAGRHVRGPGEDLRAGQTVLEPGTRLGPVELGVAVGAGRGTLRCARVPRVAVLATGDELTAPGEPLGPGALHDSNGVLLAGLARRAGADVVLTARVADTPAATRAAIAQALHHADVLLLSGGVSVGAHDHVKDALRACGVREAFWRIALKPGKPTWFGTTQPDGTGGTVARPRLVFGLPGNPVSAAVTFLLFARPALAALQGASASAVPLRARLAEAIPREPHRAHAVRVRVRDGQATPTGPSQGSHVLSSLLGADGLVIVAAGEGDVAAGTEVAVEPI